MVVRLIPLLILAAFSGTSALASTEEPRRMLDERLLDRFSALYRRNATPALDPDEAFVRKLAVLDHFSVPPESDPRDFFQDLQEKTSLEQIRLSLPYFDADGVFPTFSRTGGELQVYQDRGSRKVLDYSVSLSEAPTDGPSASFHENLLKASRNPDSLPLAGLRIALDPGHMGGDLWDERTGKFVRDRQGRKLSEGLMALQISLLLEKSFRELGAEVLVTRHGLAPVSSLPYESFDLSNYALKELQESTLLPWFESLLAKGPAGPRLFDAFSSSRDFRKLFSESQRWRYFVLRADLDARVQMIREFSPDITLIIHLDATEPPGDPSGVSPRPHDGTKAYVPGAFALWELASRADRKYFGRHLLDARARKASIDLSRGIVGQLHSRLNVPFDPADPSNSIQIEPGVLARNLNVQRRLTSQATSYVECLFYNDPNEFAALLRTTHPLMIDGVNRPYSDRLDGIHRALRDAVVSFVREYHE